MDDARGKALGHDDDSHLRKDVDGIAMDLNMQSHRVRDREFCLGHIDVTTSL